MKVGFERRLRVAGEQRSQRAATAGAATANRQGAGVGVSLMDQAKLLRPFYLFLSFGFSDALSRLDFHHRGGKGAQKQALVFAGGAATPAVDFFYLAANTFRDGDFVILGLLDEARHQLP